MKQFMSWLRRVALVFAIAGAPLVQAANDLSELGVSPNPVRLTEGHREATFNNVTEDVHIQIFSARGALVRNLFIEASGGAARWDLKNEAGENVASGVYICLVTNAAGEHKKAKLAIIR